MSKFELVFDLIIGFIFFGVIGTLGGFLALLFWSGFGFDLILKLSVAIGATAGILGAAVPFMRKSAVFFLTLFAPSGW